MPDIQSVLREEIRRLARKEIRSELEATRKAVSQQRQQIAELKRRNKALERTVSDLHSREMERMKAEPSKGESRKGTRFSVRSLKAQRRRLRAVPGGLRAPRRRRQIDDPQLGEWRI